MTESNHDLRVSDALDGMKSLLDRSVDCIITDPAYDSLEKWRSMGTTTRLKESKGSSNKWFGTIGEDYYVPLFNECLRILRRDSYLWVMCDEVTSHVVYDAMLKCGISNEKVGFAYWRKVGKPDGPPCATCGHQKLHPGAPGMGYPFRAVIEKIVFAKHGKPGMPKDRSVRNDLGQYWIEEPHLKGDKYWPTEKPVPLVEVMIRQSNLQPGSLVVDPFAGSGSTGEAAFNLGHQFLGFDIDPEAREYFLNRKKSWVRQDGAAVCEESEELPLFFT